MDRYSDSRPGYDGVVCLNPPDRVNLKDADEADAKLTHGLFPLLALEEEFLRTRSSSER